MDNFTDYINQLSKLENADAVNEVNSFCILNKSTLSYFDSVWGPLQEILSSGNVSFSIISSLQSSLPVLSSIKNEYEDLLEGRISDSCKKEVVSFKRRVQNTTLDNCKGVLDELRALISRNKVVVSLPASDNHPKPSTAPCVNRTVIEGKLNITCVGYDGLLVNPATKLYYNGSLLGSFPMSQGYSIEIPLNSSQIEIELKGGLGLKRGFFSEIVDPHKKYYLEFNYNYITGHYKSSFCIIP